MKKIFFLFVIVLLTIACNSTEKSLSRNEYQELLQQTILPVPDTLLNKEQLALRIKILDFLHEHTYIENNCQKLSVGKDSMVRAGIPAIYYDIISYQYKETNDEVKRMIESGEIPAIHLNLDSLMRESNPYYWNTERPRLLKMLESK